VRQLQIKRVNTQTSGDSRNASILEKIKNTTGKDNGNREIH
jgi:hypothetical protein